jgi:ketosteroid isomerase-like protein
MDSNRELIRTFFSAFQNRNFEAMRNCCNDNLVYFDPLYHFLNGEHVLSMWKCRYAYVEKFCLEFSDIVTDDNEYYTIQYHLSYVAEETGKVVNQTIKSYMRVLSGKIVEHSDAFSIHQWSSMVYGTIAKLIGWNRFYQNRLKKNARKKLLKFIGHQH